MADRGRDRTPTPEEYREQMRRQRALERKIRRGKKRWRVFLAIYTLLFLLAGAGGCFVLYRYCEAYERSLPEHVMDDFMASTTQEQWYDYIRSGVELPVSEFEDGEALFDAYYDAAIRGSRFSYWKYMEEYTSQTPVYKVRGGGMDLCLVRLKPRGSNAAGFGRQLWQVGEIRSILKLDRLQSVTVEIDAPAGEKVYLNGKLLGEENLTGEKAPVPDLTDLESRFDVLPSYQRYRVENMYGEITVTDEDGAALPPIRENGSDRIRYVVRQEEKHSFTVRAPETVTVTVCGAVLPKNEAERIEKGVLEGLEQYTGNNAFDTLTWHYEGLYTQPEITAVGRSGKKLTPLVNEKGELIFFNEEDKTLAEEVRPWAEDFFEKYINYSGKAYEAGRHQMLLNTILPDTELYRYVRDSKDAMLWASATEVHYDELTFADFSPVGDNCCTCTIRYKGDFAATAWHESYNYEMQNAYELSFVRVGDIWYAAAMSVVAG